MKSLPIYLALDLALDLSRSLRISFSMSLTTHVHTHTQTHACARAYTLTRAVCRCVCVCVVCECVCVWDVGHTQISRCLTLARSLARSLCCVCVCVVFVCVCVCVCQHPYGRGQDRCIQIMYFTNIYSVQHECSYEASYPRYFHASEKWLESNNYEPHNWTMTSLKLLPLGAK
jgi:hypothetical protein